MNFPTVNRVRWTILFTAFFILLFGAYLNLYFGSFLPTFSCCYVRARAGTCFMLTLQQTLGEFTWKSMAVFLERFFYFSVLVIILGRSWCGWICPLGLFQDILDWVRVRLHIGYIRFNRALARGLSWIKWVFLSVAVLLPVWVAFPLFCPCVALNLHIPFCQICPGKYILPFVVGNPDRIALDMKNGTTITMSVLGLTFSIMTIIGALFKRRFFCSFCPLGLIMGLYRKISFFKLTKNDTACTRCEICYNVCPVDIEEVFESRGEKDVTQSKCILCLKCVEHCPEENALSATYLGKTIYRSKAHVNEKGTTKKGIRN